MRELRLRPSASGSWFNCPGFVYYDLSMDETTSEAAERGTMLHEAAAGMLLDLPNREPLFGDDLEIVLNYVEYVDKLRGGSIMHVEKRMEFCPVLGGTADCIIRKPGELHILDLKTGMAMVSAKDNTQLLVYLVMAMMEYKLDVESTRMFIHIVQPPIENYDTWEVPPDKLVYALGMIIDSREKIAKQYETNEWEFAPSLDNCRWCKGAAVCKARRDYVTKDFIDKPVTKYTPEELAAVLKKAADIKTWVDAVEKYALSEALNGNIPPGYQIGESRTMRRWESDIKAETRLVQLGVASDDIWKQVLVSPAQAEKLVDKEDIEDIIIKPKGKPVLVISDF